jgi:hypothetical protein
VVADAYFHLSFLPSPHFLELQRREPHIKTDWTLGEQGYFRGKINDSLSLYTDSKKYADKFLENEYGHLSVRDFFGVRREFEI